MSNNNLNDLFENLENRFDVETPNLGHQQRFFNKLVKQNKNNEVYIKTLTSKSKLWKPFIGIAASFALLVSVFVFINQHNSQIDLSEISPEMAQTQTVFTTMFNNELSKINSEEMPEYQDLIVDALYNIKVIEEDYNQLIIGLNENPNDQLIMSAMILNFQSRIDILQDVMQEIEKAEKSTKNEPNII
ncbi:hypothetical protein L3X37_12400 [Sabulilitoribacter arenilitoris]|uniref:Anti-sigma factor n=1 Tax=Wocania arenilitoris TaxID=2044858 RepID=A0AAE3EQJ3_9FLAO|nr:hypothetical protein [Wocania arenilitoris]MCF7569157.1 hypothetical protein [Wocania arenilitoris]